MPVDAVALPSVESPGQCCWLTNRKLSVQVLTDASCSGSCCRCCCRQLAAEAYKITQQQSLAAAKTLPTGKALWESRLLATCACYQMNPKTSATSLNLLLRMLSATDESPAYNITSQGLHNAHESDKYWPFMVMICGGSKQSLTAESGRKHCSLRQHAISGLCPHLATAWDHECCRQCSMPHLLSAVYSAADQAQSKHLRPAQCRATAGSSLCGPCSATAAPHHAQLQAHTALETSPMFMPTKSCKQSVHQCSWHEREA